MFQLIPAPLHRLALKLAHALRKRWWQLRKPRLEGVNVLVFDATGQLLLVRHSYGFGSWTLPGGGLRKSEDPAIAARREVSEELGCALRDLARLGVNQRSLFGAPCTTHIYAGQIDGYPHARSARSLRGALFRARRIAA